MRSDSSATPTNTEAFPGADLLLDAAARGIRYRAVLPTRRVAPTAEAVAQLAGLSGSLPERGRAARAIIGELDRLGSPATVGMAGGRYFGFVNGSSLPVTVASNWLATAWDQNAALHAMSPTVAAIESIARGWTLDALRLPAESAGAFVSPLADVLHL